MWIFESPENYAKMVEKISKSVFMVSLLILYFISCINEEFRVFLETFSFGAVYEIFGVKLNLALLYVPVSMGVLEHVFKIHDKLSWLLKIRVIYDKYIVIWGFYKTADIAVKIRDFKKEEIKVLMSKVFYKYASSTDPKIDSHSISLTLNEWCWFWIALDSGVLILLVGSLFLALNWSWFNLWLLCIVCFIIVTVLFLILLQTIQYTNKEIEAILSDDKRKQEVKKVLKDALHNK